MLTISELKYWEFLQQCPWKYCQRWPKFFVIYAYEHLGFFKVWIVRFSYLLSLLDVTVFTRLYEDAVKKAGSYPVSCQSSFYSKTPYISAHYRFSFCDSCHALRAPDLVMKQQLFYRHAWPGLFCGAMCTKTTLSDDNWHDLTACRSTTEQPNTRYYLFTLTWFIRSKGVSQSLTCPRRSLDLSFPPTKSG